MNVDNEQLWIFVSIVREEVFSVADHSCQLQLLSLLCHLSYIIQRPQIHSFLYQYISTKWIQIKIFYRVKKKVEAKIVWMQFGCDNNMSIKYIGFCKGSSSLPVFGVTLDRTLDQALKTEIPKVIIKLKELELKKEERQRIKSEFGVWFAKKDSKDMFYLALCVNTYPERHIYAAVGQLQAHLAQLGDYETEPDATLKLHAKEKLNEIAQKYDNLKGVDKIGEANRLLDGIKEDIADSTLKLMNNTVNLQGLERKASDLKENAAMFEQSATEIEREMWCRNCKMKVIIGLVVVALICVIVIPIATTVGKK